MEESVAFEKHYHNAHEPVYIREGDACFRIGGAVYSAGPHTLLFISKLEEYSVDIRRGPYRRWYIQLTPAQPARAVEESRLRAVFASRPAGFCHAFDADGAAGQAEALPTAMTRDTVPAALWPEESCRLCRSCCLSCAIANAAGSSPCRRGG